MIDSRHIILKDSQSNINSFPENPPILSSLGIVYAGLGKYEKAVDFAQRAYTLMPYENDIIRGEIALTDLAFVYMKAGRYEDALGEIDFLLSKPSEMTINLLEIDPKWAALKEQPGFRKLAAKYGSEK